MKIHYTGKLVELTKEQKKNLDNHFAKLGKLVDHKGEREAHVMLNSQRHTQKAEVTMTYYGHLAAGMATHKDQFFALLAAIDKLEKQMQKLHDKWIDSKRHGVGINGKKAPIPSGEKFVAPAKSKALKPTRVQRTSRPISIEEGPLAIKPASACLVFEQIGSGVIHVLVRRDDGQFDLIEAR